MYVDESALVAGSNSATFRNQAPSAVWTEIPVCSFLIETGAGLVLFDTGCHAREAAVLPGADTVSPYVYAPGQLLPERLNQMNIAHEDVRCVVVSHLHCDHAGYLHLFKNAEIIVSDLEFTGALRLYGLRGFGAGPYKAKDFDMFLNAGLNWRLLDPDESEYELCPGVTAIHFGSGHAFGMTGLNVELPKSGNFLLCSDALYRSENLGPPLRLPGFVYDSLGYIATAKFIERYAKKHGAEIVFGHDRNQFDTLIKNGCVYE
jgi:glyoxylase-like metal-dependent hydrolase (beta-lactamase superfamily II)